MSVLHGAWILYKTSTLLVVAKGQCHDFFQQISNAYMCAEGRNMPIASMQRRGGGETFLEP
jgi:hypothetical protein